MKIEIKYNPQEDEKKEQDKWFNCDLYYWDKSKPQDLDFVIDTPPPTVSGVLHMGHVFSYCQTDFVARYQRMCGKNVFYPIGFDDNGLPTERLVEKTHNVKGAWMNKQGRKKEFIDLCYGVVENAEKEFEKLFKTLGISYDWRQKYQTISKSTNDLAVETYNKLKKAGLIEQRNGAVYWDVVDQTALAQSIIEDKEVAGAEHYLIWDIFDTKDSETPTEQAVIMTTRPELLPACVAVFYNPEDSRFTHLKGKCARFSNIMDKVPCLPDEAVRIDKGTGLVMCCTYGDWQDVEWVRKHQNSFFIKNNSGISSRIIVDKEGRFNSEIGFNIKSSNVVNDERKFVLEYYFSYKQNEKWQYPKAIEARKQIIDFIQQNTPEKIKEIKPIKHMVKVGERSKEPVEIIESTQLYVKTLDFKEDLLVLAKYVNFHPAHLKNRLIQWIEGLNQDWCISRDRFFGIEIPDNGDLQQVFDTWFASSSSPYVCRESERLERSKGEYDGRLKNTTALRPQAHEIIRTWTFSTMLKTYLMALIDNNLLEERARNRDRIADWLEKDLGEKFIIEKLIPWKDVMLSGWCLAKDGAKMSKSAGNVITPTSLIQEKGSDIVRYWAGSCSLGVDTAFNETKFLDGKKLVNKLLNATKFATMHFERQNLQEKSLAECVKLIDKTADKWIVSRLVDVIKQYQKAFNEFEYSVAKNAVERLFWDEYCDNYLEIVKGRAYADDLSALATLRVMTEAFLLLFAPYVSHLTSAVYREIFNKEVHKCGSFAELFAIDFADKQAVEDMKIGLDIINFVRQKKADLKVSIKAPIKKLAVKEMPSSIEDDIKAMLSVENVEEVSDFEVVL
ncbi:MAG: class I tRNA ligase family protein [Rickettsiales bacterium]|nr:class I tRNA ligase family protein [Rickettsiales bacterium]